MSLEQRRNITDSVVFLFFLEYQEHKMSIFGIFFILYFLKLSACCCLSFNKIKLNQLNYIIKFSTLDVFSQVSEQNGKLNFTKFEGYLKEILKVYSFRFNFIFI